MKTKIKIIQSLASVAVLAIASNSAYAAGTLASTPINNTASISYSVGGTSQTPIASAPGAGNSTPGTAGTPTTFVVDKKIDLLVTAVSSAPVAPGSTSKAITFTVENEGNSTEDFTMSLAQPSTGDDFDTSACVITAPTPLPVTLAPDATSAVTVECTIPASSGTVIDGATSDIDLLATIAGGVTETTAADTAGAVDTVFADGVGTATDGTAVTGLRNGSHSAVATYVISSADLIVAKSEVAAMYIDDDDNAATPDVLATGNQYHIPGAEITYTITVSNANGASDATHLVISDPLSTNLIFQSCTVSGPAVINAVAPIDPVPVTCGNSVSAGTAGGTVTTSSFTLPGGSGSANVETLTIKAIVN